MNKQRICNNASKYRNKYRSGKAGVLLLCLLLFCLAVFTACGSGGQQTEGAAASENAGGSQVLETTDDLYAAVKKTADETASALTKNVPNPGVASVGGEWLVVGTLACGCEVPEGYYDHYFDNVRAAVKSTKGVLSETHYTEYARVLIALSALGKDASDIEGYDLRPYLDDAEKIEAQGPAAAAFALIAAKTCGFPLESEEQYLDLVLTEGMKEQKMGDEVLTDYISMGIEALSFYQDREEVKQAIDQGLKILSGQQRDTGALNNTESTAECVIALTQVGVDPVKDERFVKNGKNLYDGLMEFYLGNGAFFHDGEAKEADPMAAERALLALGALLKNKEGLPLYQEK